MSDDPFATAPTTFAGLGDLEGRTVVIVPLRLESGIPSNRPNGGTYERVIADVIVLDGEPDEELGIDELPATIEEMFISGSVVVPQVKTKVKSHQPIIGVVVKTPSKTKGNAPAVMLDGKASVTDEARALARKAYDAYLKSQEDPFADAS